MTEGDLFIEANCALAALAAAFSAALGLRQGTVKVITGGDGYPERGTCDAFVEAWPIKGDCRIRASVFLVSDEANASAPDDAALGQSLADGLGCGVCVPMDDPDPWKHMCFRSGADAAPVTLDFARLDEEGVLAVRPYVNVWADTPLT